MPITFGAHGEETMWYGSQLAFEPQIAMDTHENYMHQDTWTWYADSTPKHEQQVSTTQTHTDMIFPNIGTRLTVRHDGRPFDSALTHVF